MAATCLSTWDIIPSAICGFLMIVMLIFTVQFIHAFMQQHIKVSKTLFTGGLSFFIVILLAMTNQLISYLMQCSHPSVYVVMVSTRSVLFMLKWLLLIAILFYRLYDPFKGTALSLSKYTVYSFLIYYTLTIGTLLFCVFAVFFENARRGPLEASWWRIILGSVTFLNIWIFIVFLVCLFIHKLVQAYHFADQHGEGFIALITKISLLFFASTLCYLLTTVYLIVVVAVLGLNSNHWLFVLRMLALLEGSTNFLSVFLTFGEFDAYYAKICGCPDWLCHRFWEKCIGRPQTEKLRQWVRGAPANSSSEMQMAVATPTATTPLPDVQYLD